jgi:hypothetical protein
MLIALQHNNKNIVEGRKLNMKDNQNYMIIKRDSNTIIDYYTDYDNIVAIAQLLSKFEIKFYIIDTKNNTIILSN